MKIRFCCAMLVMALLSAICFAQAPVPVLVGSPNEMSANFLLPVKGSSLAESGYGGHITSTRYFTQHFGAELQADYERTNWCDFREQGVRVGPIVRFASKQSVQPYMEVLVGYARVRAAYLRPVNSFHGGGSALIGGGLEYRLSSGWYAKTGLDFESDWAASTKLARGNVGLSYRFGGRQSGTR